MTLIQKLSSLVAGLCLTASPALARIDAGTPALLTSLPAYGINVALNHPDCEGQTQFAGYFHSGTNDFVVCYSGVPGASDHDTVRHEAMHVAQSCVAKRSGYPSGIVPILQGEDHTEFVNSVLSPMQIERIKAAYPEDHWLIELEAFAGAQEYTAAQVQNIVRTWCQI